MIVFESRSSWPRSVPWIENCRLLAAEIGDADVGHRDAGIAGAGAQRHAISSTHARLRSTSRM
jgi:hypothetical protein